MANYCTFSESIGFKIKAIVWVYKLYIKKILILNNLNAHASIKRTTFSIDHKQYFARKSLLFTKP